jgi:hypothetical protein
VHVRDGTTAHGPGVRTGTRYAAVLIRMPLPDHRPRDSSARADHPAGYPVALDGAGQRDDLFTVERWSVSDQGRSKCM